MTKLEKKKLNENWKEPKKVLIFNKDVFLRHPDDDSRGDGYLLHPEYIFSKGSRWEYYWPETDESTGFIALKNKEIIRIVLIEDIIYHEGQKDITIIEDM